MALKRLFLAAALLAASVSTMATRLTSPDAVTANQDVDYDAIAKLADMLPSMQQHHSPRVPSLTTVVAAADPTPSSDGRVTRRAGPMRVLVAGDSMTQGREGDYTWRYRMWDWMVNSQGLAVDFVGPYQGTRSPDDAQPPSPPPLYHASKPAGDLRVNGGYAAGANPNFDSDHFAVWGRACAEDVGGIQAVVQNAQPDVMLIMLGFNDLGWFFSDDDGLLRNMHTLIQNARAAAPNVKIALANVPMRTSLGREDLPRLTNSYNQKLAAAIPGWSTAQSPIYEVLLRENYQCELNGCPVGSDGLHPNAVGEYEIAQAFSQTLVNKMGIGKSVLQIPANVPQRLAPAPSNFKVFSSNYGVTATWDAVYGAYGYNVRYRLSGASDWTTGGSSSNRFDTHWPFDGATYEIQVRPGCGDGCSGEWTAIGSAVAKPLAASAPPNVGAVSSGNSITVNWDTPTKNAVGISEYNVLFWDQSQPCSIIGGAAFTSSPGTITDLVPGHKYFIAVTAWNGNGEGWPALTNNIIAGSGAPAQPGNVVAGSIDEFTAHITWDPVDGAAGYRLWTRQVNNASSVSSPSNGARDTTCADVGWVVPGVENWEFCVEAFNGKQASGHANCHIPAKHASGAAAVASCAAATAGQSTGCGWGSTPTFSDPPTSSATPPPKSTSTPLHDHPGPTTTTTQKPYQTHTCNDKDVTNASGSDVDFSTYWDDLDCTDAWIDVEVAWENDAPHLSSYQFTQEMAHTFNQTSPNWNCQNLTYGGPTNCKVPITCESVSSPAAWFIMNSIVGLEGVISSVAGTLTINEGYATTQASALVNAFGNIDDGKLEAILSIVSLGMGVLGTPMFGDLIKELNSVTAVTRGTTLAGVKDATTNLAAQSIAVVNQASGNNPFSETAALDVQIGKIINTWQTALTDFNTGLFNGSPDNITQILHYIIDGYMFTGSAVPTITEKSWLDRALYPLLINYLWGLGHAPVFVMDVGKPCDAANPPKAPISGNKTETYHCVNGNSYYLASANGSPYVPSGCNPANPHMDCSNADFSEPPGLGALQPGNQWGGVLPEDFATGSVLTYINNGNKNGVDNSPTFASDIVGQIYDVYSNPHAVFQLPGFFNLPVCTADQARSAWKEYHLNGGTKSPTYPC